MTEQLTKHEQKGETLDKVGSESAAEHARNKIEAAAEKAESSKETVASIESRVEQARPTSAEAVKKQLEPTPQQQTVLPPDNAGKQQALRTYLGRVRHHLSGPGQAFSKFVHNPAVNALSEAAGNTIIRPSGICTGGVFALLGSGYYYYETRSTGYSYNFTVALLLLGGGFVVGVVVEMMYKLLTKRRA